MSSRSILVYRASYRTGTKATQRKLVSKKQTKKKKKRKILTDATIQVNLRTSSAIYDSYRGTYIMYLHLREIPRTVKIIEKESRMVAIGSWRLKNGK